MGACAQSMIGGKTESPGFMYENTARSILGNFCWRGHSQSCKYCLVVLTAPHLHEGLCDDDVVVREVVCILALVASGITAPSSAQYLDICTHAITTERLRHVIS